MLVVDGTSGVTFNDSSLQGAAASPYVLKNRLINGDMRIDQRNAGASVSITTGVFGVDRWYVQSNVGSGHTLQRSTTAPTGFVNSQLITIGTGATPTGSNYFRTRQGIEGLNVADLGWGTANAQTITISFWVRCSLTGSFGLGVMNDAGNRNYIASYTINAANTWEYKSVTISGDTTGTWLTDNNTGIYLGFDLGEGPDRSRVAGSWGVPTSAGFGLTSGVKLAATSGATFYITGVQLEVGTSATPFERRLYNQELANCQRYFYIYTAASWFQSDSGGYARQPLQVVGTTGSKWYPQYPVPMRVCPTIASANMASAATSIYNYSTASSLAISSIAAQEGSIVAGQINFNVTSGFSIGNTATWRFEGINSGTYISFSAEL